MEENENKKQDGAEGQKPEDNVTPTPEEEKEDKKNKVVAFFAPKRNKIIVGVSAAALIALIIGLSAGLSKCSSGGGGTITSDAFASALKIDGEKFTVSIVEDKENGSSAKRIKNGTAIHITQNSGTISIQDAYYTVESTGSETKYYSYDKDSSGFWIKSEDASKNYVTYSSYDANKEAFDDKLTYAGLTFDKSKGCYTATYSNNVGTSVSAELYFKNNKITKALKSFTGGSSFVYTFSNDAETITLPSAHVHTVTSGSLDLNGTTPKIKGTCSGCQKEVTKDYEATDTASVITYGYYPQTHVSDATTIASLNALTSAESNGWYLLDGTYYAKVAEAIPYGDAYYFSDGAIIIGYYSYWFKVEAIEWKAISSSDGQYSLVSSLILDYRQFHSVRTGNANDYASSDLRTWLTGTFYNAVFSNGGSYLQTYTSGDLNDKVYLNSSGDQCRVSDYAKAIGAPLASGTDYGNYWTTALSSPMSSMATVAFGDGGYNYQDVTMTYGVRPAITVKVS